METGANQTAVPAPTAAALDDPTTQGQVHEPASVHRIPGSNLIVEEVSAARPQSPHQAGRSRSRDRARSAGRYLFEELTVENAQPAEHGLTPGQPDYFQSLVASALETRTLPIVKTSPSYQIETAQLYPFAPAQLQVTSQDLDGEHGTALALELAINLQTSHIAAKVRSEMTNVATAGRTSDKDLKRMRSLLFQLNNQYHLRSQLGPYRDAVLRHRLDAGDLFPRNLAEENETIRVERRSRRRLRGYESSDRYSSESSRADQQPRRFPFIWNMLSRARRRSRSRNSGASYYSYSTATTSTDSTSNGPSALEEGRTPPAGRERREEAKKTGSFAKFIDSVAFGLVLIVCFVPGLLYLGAQLLLPKSKNDSGNEWTETTMESYRKQVRRLDYSRKKGFPERLVAALVGGFSLIAPMIIMSLDPSLKKSLITTSIFILVFGVVLAWRTSMQSGEVLTATATYAAVLVVFTGVSN